MSVLKTCVCHDNVDVAIVIVYIWVVALLLLLLVYVVFVDGYIVNVYVRVMSLLGGRKWLLIFSSM